MMKGSNNKSNVNCLYLPLSPMSRLIAEVFYKKYISIWSSRERDEPYILRTTLSSYLKLYENGFIEKFLSGHVYYDQFFQFVCIMTLMGYERVVLLVLASCKVYSNIFITYDQIIEFANIFDKDHKSDINVYLSKNYYSSNNETESNGNMYLLKSFIAYANINYTFETTFCYTKYIIEKELFPHKYVKIINRKYQFYTMCRKKITNEKDFKIPKESCFNRICRLFTGEPHPYSYNFIINEHNPKFYISDDYIDTLVIEIKQTYGYGFRSSKSKPKKGIPYNEVHYSLKSKSCNCDKCYAMKCSSIDNKANSNSIKMKAIETSNRFDNRSKSYMSSPSNANI